MDKELLFSVTRDDFIIQTYKSSGPGGQHKNKTESGVRIIHPDSGARAECCESRSQHQNRIKAFERLVQSKEFTKWLKMETAKRLGALSDIEDQVNRDMRPENLRIEKLENGIWKPYVEENENT